MIKSLTDNRPPFSSIGGLIPENFHHLPTPCYVLDEGKLMENGKILKRVQEESGCKILLAQKAFSNFTLYDALAPYLAGTEASGLYEARLGKEEMPDKEVHVFCGAYKNEDFDELLTYADHIVFNSPNQLMRFADKAHAAGKSIGLRVNPECSTQEGHAIYDPCAPGSRLGTTRAQLDEALLTCPDLLSKLDGIHFHTLCEQNSDDLQTTLIAVDEHFGDILQRDNIKWLNMGGGHHITRIDYDIDRLIRLIKKVQEKYHVTVYLEPGEACALNAGYLLTRVLDTLKNGDYKLAILDMSPSCHTPDVIEMPYKPPLFSAIDPDDNDIPEDMTIIRLGGPSCLSGDVVGDYAFPAPLKEGDLLVFGDMAIYSTCKNNTFNGMPLPAILKRDEKGDISLIKRFGYEDFKMRLG